MPSPPRPSRLPRLVLAALATLPACPLAAADAPRLRLQVRTGEATTVEAPVLAPLSADIPDGSYRLRGDGVDEQDAQVLTEKGRRWLGTVLRPGPADRRFVLEPRPEPSPRDPARGVVLAADGGNVKVAIDGRPFTAYRTDVGAKPFLFPLLGPDGTPYTRAYPMADVPGEDRDHPHQRSFWFTHGKVNGVDFWSEQKGHGTIAEVGRTAALSGPVLGRLATANVWRDPAGAKVCEDRRILTVYRTSAGRVLDYEVTLVASAGKVTFGDTKEGMFGVRVASSMDVTRKAGGKIVNAEGLTDEKAWGKASPWVDYSGPAGGKTVGIAILNHPSSFRHPTTWHVRTYGLFAANPFGWHDFGLGKSGEHVLPDGEQIRFAYRVILHEGEGNTGDLKSAYALYAEPPSVEVLGD